MTIDRGELRDALSRTLGSPRFSQVLTVAIVCSAYFSFALRSLIGWPGLIAIVSTLVVIAAGSLAVKRAELEWRGILPISLLVFLGWSALSLLWSQYQWTTLAAVLYQLAFAFLAVYVALTRDLIQVVRAFGDVLRVLLFGSLVIEVVAGVLLDTSVGLLGIEGDLAFGGPIQGLVGTRNQLGLIALVGLVTFLIEWNTRSVHRPIAIGSVAVAAVCVLFARSPVAFGAFILLSLAAVVLVGLRRTPPEGRRVAQFVLLGATVIALAIGFLLRTRIVAALNAGSEFEFRYFLWRDVLSASAQHTIEGYGWIGYWRGDIPPFVGLQTVLVPHQSALSAYLDVLLQLGIVGLFSLIALIGLALVRSWLLGANRRSVNFVWLALIMLLLTTVSAAESFALVEFGWFTLVVCLIKASQDLSWRSRLPE